MSQTEHHLDLIRAAYPDLRIESVRPIVGAGQFSDVLVVNEALVFRFPRSQEVAQEMARETAILRQIQGRITLPIPNPIYSVIDPSTRGQVLMGYPLLAGEPATRDVLSTADDSVVQKFAADLVGFLQEMHSIDPLALNLDLPVQGARDEWVSLYQQFRADLYPYMRRDARENVSATFDSALSDASLWDFQPVLIHGDLGAGNLLIDPVSKAICGIIDFGMCGLGDPAQDVGAVWSFGDRLMHSFFILYPEMRATVRRVEFIRSTYALQQALHALRFGDQADFEDGIQDYI